MIGARKGVYEEYLSTLFEHLLLLTHVTNTFRYAQVAPDCIAPQLTDKTIVAFEIQAFKGLSKIGTCA